MTAMTGLTAFTLYGLLREFQESLERKCRHCRHDRHWEPSRTALSSAVLYVASFGDNTNCQHVSCISPCRARRIGFTEWPQEDQTLTKFRG
jgi:hypothetical protein